MATKKKAEQSVEIVPLVIEQGRITFYLVGNSPFIYNAMSFKTKMELLKPAKKKTKAEKESTLKHKPLEEYRDSVYRRRDDEDGPTRLIFPASAFKKALTTVALRVPGAHKTELNQLTWVEGANVDIYGVPELLMSVVRNSDIKRTPDIRTRAILPEWAAKITIRYMQPMLTAQTLAQLLEYAGLLMGIGDFRQEKGAGSYGQFRQVAEDDVDFARIVANGGMEAQDAALATPATHDHETDQLFSQFIVEMAKADPKQRKSATT